MKQQNRQRQMAKQRRQAKRRQRVPMSHPTGPSWLKGTLEDRVCYGMLALYYGQQSEGQAIIDDLKRRYPAHGLVRFLPTYARMLRGDYSREVMRAWRQTANRPRTFPQPLWDGSPHPDHTLLIWHPDWGYGDTFQWVRMVAAAKQQFGGRVVLEVREGLSRVLQGLAGADEIIEPEPVGPFDWQVPQDLLPSVIDVLPEHLEMTPYLFPDAALVERWRPTFANPEVLHVGLHWQAESGVRWGPTRSIPLAELSAIFGLPDVRYYSLQPGADLSAYPGVRDLSHEDTAEARFCQTAAILAHVDVLVACDSSVAHLAGALARPCWALIGLPCDAQWGTAPDRAPFYPTHQKYVQRRPGDWTEILEQVRTNLEADAWHKRRYPT